MCVSAIFLHNQGVFFRVCAFFLCDVTTKDDGIYLCDVCAQCMYAIWDSKLVNMKVYHRDGKKAHSQ